MNPTSDTSSYTSRRRPSAAARNNRSGEAPSTDLGPTNGTANGPDRNGSRGFFPLIVSVVGLAMLVGAVVYWVRSQGSPTQPIESPTAGPIPTEFDSERAFAYLVKLCDIGPRPSGSEGMKRQQDYLKEFFEAQGGEVTLQTFPTRHPVDGSTVTMANLIASWYPSRVNRYVLCAHYDTRPFPDRDRFNKRGVFVGANDGASGTAALMELSHQLKDLPEDIGVDLVLFDGEEFVFEERRDPYFLGSIHFAEQYAANPPVNPYRAGILLDMVGDRELKIYFEQNSIRYAREVARSVWSTAASLGVTAFVPRTRHELRDDHLPLNQIAKIPTIDIIDFDYPRPGIAAPTYWHTEADTPDKCSGESLASVVWVVHTWLVDQSQLAR